MKAIEKLIFTAIAVLMLCMTAHAAGPYLTCDPQPGITKHDYMLDGIVVAADVPAKPDGSCWLDLSTIGIADGSHTFTVRAGNIWDWSEYSDPFGFNRSLPGKPAGIALTAE